MADLAHRGDGKRFVITLADRDDFQRAEGILRAAVLTINDRVAPLYAGQAMPARTSDLERDNYA